jgi:hypothetical protein
MGERYAEPMRRDIDELSFESHGASLQIQPHFAFTNEPRLQPVIQDRRDHAGCHERETKGTELRASHHAFLQCIWLAKAERLANLLKTGENRLDRSVDRDKLSAFARLNGTKCPFRRRPVTLDDDFAGSTAILEEGETFGCASNGMFQTLLRTCENMASHSTKLRACFLIPCRQRAMIRIIRSTKGVS